MFRPVHPKRVCLTLLVAVAAIFVPVASASAAAPQIVNSSTWLESLATSGESGKGGNWVSVTTVVKHDPGVTIDQLQFDDDWDGTTDPTSTKTNFTAQKMNVAGGADYTRISYRYQIPTSNTGMDCGFLSGTRRTDNRNLRVRVRQNDGTYSSTLSNQRQVRRERPVHRSRGLRRASAAESSRRPRRRRVARVLFNYTGDDADGGITGDRDFQGIRYRLRRLSDGATTGTTLSCPEQRRQRRQVGERHLPGPRPLGRRGRAAMDGDGCGANQNGGYWFWLGAVDVNTSATSSPTASLGGTTRPTLNGNVTVTATVDDPSDSADGGTVQNIEWDLDENTGNGVGGFESAENGSPTTGLTAAQRTRDGQHDRQDARPPHDPGAGH